MPFDARRYRRFLVPSDREWLGGLLSGTEDAEGLGHDAAGDRRGELVGHEGRPYPAAAHDDDRRTVTPVPSIPDIPQNAFEP